MRIFICLFLLLPVIAACSSQTELVGMNSTKRDPICFEYSSGMKWDAIQGNFGEAPLSLLNEPEKELSMNVPGYSNLEAFFYTDPRETKRECEVPFDKTVYKVKICKQE